MYYMSDKNNRTVTKKSRYYLNYAEFEGFRKYVLRFPLHTKF